MTRLKLMKGVTDKERTQSAEALADQGAQKATPDDLNTHIIPELKLTGAKLNKITQAQAYKAIRDQKMKKYKQRRRTKINIAQAKTAAKALTGILPDERSLWKNIR